jgi:hypothetical protein
VPAAPSPGDAGAGALAGQSVPLGRDGLAAALTFGGVVLEQRAVGVTVTYPRVRLTTDGTRALASVELPTYNCLADAAPDDPVAAGCSRAVAEYAELTTPALHVERSGPRAQPTVRITGRFPTYTRPNGTPPVWTGAVYELTVTAAADGSGAGRQVPATGEFRLGGDAAAAVRGSSALRFRD